MTRIAIAIAVALLLAGSLAGIGFKVGRDSANAKHAAMAALITEAADAMEVRTAGRIAAIRVVNQTITGQVRETIRENTVYRDCVVPADMQRMLELAREGRAEPAIDRSSLPATGEGAALEPR
jgi:hypothetical protein